MREFGVATLAHTRLRIIDLSASGDQPMSNEDGSVWVVFNGEIYNFRELRAELIAAGHQFRSATDSEVLVHLYEERGDRMAERLEGMFAFAIWDDRRGRLLLVRDGLGIKPLYYRAGPGGLSFASEVRALATGASIDHASVDAYLRLGWVPGPSSAATGIVELLPGHQLSWESGVTEVHRWWTPRTRSPLPLPEALREAVRDQLVADVPVGLFLSSGVDSAVIAQLVSELGAGVDAYTVGFEEESDEVADAAAIAGHLGLRHHVVMLRSADVQSSLRSIIGSMDQPTVDGVNSWVISKAVRDAGLVVALSGLGGDELFQGYSTFRHVPRFAALQRPAGRLSALVAPHLRGGRVGRSVEAIAGGSPAAAYVAVRGLFSEAEVTRLRPGRLTPRPGTLIDEPWLPWGGDAGAVSQLELANYLPYQLLRDTDCMSMAHSLEVRVPLLDGRVVDSVLAAQTAGNAMTKADLVAAADPGLHAFLGSRKRTFTLPFATWLRGPLRASVLDGLGWLGESSLGFDRRELTAAWVRYDARGESWRPVWALAVLAWWLQAQHEDGRLVLDG